MAKEYKRWLTITTIHPSLFQAQIVTKMSPVDIAPEVTQNLLIAAKSTDFGGFTGPIVGLLTVFGLILVLAPPLKYD